MQEGAALSISYITFSNDIDFYCHASGSDTRGNPSSRYDTNKFIDWLKFCEPKIQQVGHLKDCCTIQYSL